MNIDKVSGNLLGQNFGLISLKNSRFTASPYLEILDAPYCTVPNLSSCPKLTYSNHASQQESIPRMMDNPRSSMIHHMAQEHDDIPSGVPTSSPYCSVRCRRCRLFFQDLFIRDLHEKKACQAPECEGCKVCYRRMISICLSVSVYLICPSLLSFCLYPVFKCKCYFLKLYCS